MMSPRAGQPAAAEDLVDVAKLVTAYYDAASRPGRGRPAGVVRHLGPPRVGADRHLQRGPHRGRHPGDLRVPGRPGHRRAAVPRRRHARAVRAGAGQRARGARRQRRHGAGRRPRRLHADPGGVAGRSWPTTRAGTGPAGPTASWSRRRTTRRRDGGFKYNPPDGGPAGTEITGLDPGPGQRAARRAAWPGVRRIPYARAVAADTTGRFDFLDAYVSALRPGRRPRRDPRPPACASAPTRSAAPASATGARSASATAWT